MTKIFHNFDLAEFWEESEYATRQYVEPPPTDELVASIEHELGYKLPASYIELMQSQNGGIPKNCCFPTDAPTCWAEDHIAISGIFAIGRVRICSLCGRHGSGFMLDEWQYPRIGVCICDTPTAGHDMVMLDYRKCGPQGEPEVVHVAQSHKYRITVLAKDFETFVRGLVNDSVYDDPEEFADD